MDERKHRSAKAPGRSTARSATPKRSGEGGATRAAKGRQTSADKTAAPRGGTAKSRAKTAKAAATATRSASQTAQSEAAEAPAAKEVSAAPRPPERPGEPIMNGAEPASPCEPAQNAPPGQDGPGSSTSAAETPEGASETGAAAGPDPGVKRAPEKAGKAKSAPRAKAGETGDGAPRPNTLVPTNAVHTTQRRLKRRLHQNRAVMVLVAATLLAILILGEQTEPPDMTAFEQELAYAQGDPEPAAPDRPAPVGTARPRVSAWLPDRAVRGARDEAGGQAPLFEPSRPEGELALRDGALGDAELAEMERLLARLDFEPSAPDGVIDVRTRSAIRLYQEFAGLPVDGEPTPDLLADMREVIKILDQGG